MKAFYTGKQVLITGGSSGIGLALAKIIAHYGGVITILARRADKLAAAKAEIEGLGGAQVITLQVDISDREQVNRVLANHVQQYGTPDVLVNCAGNTYPGMFADLPLDVFDDLMAANYHGTVYVTKTILPGMIARRSGTICIVSSVAGFLGTVGYSAYGATKFALRGLSDALYYELKPHNIKMALVFPADTETPQLEFDNLKKPAITRELVGSNSKTYTAEYVATAIAKGIAAGRHIITPGADTTLFYLLTNTFGLVYPLYSFFVNQAWRKVDRTENNRGQQDQE